MTKSGFDRLATASLPAQLKYISTSMYTERLYVNMSRRPAVLTKSPGLHATATGSKRFCLQRAPEKLPDRGLLVCSVCCRGWPFPPKEVEVAGTIGAL
jgi:hypothetical protein